MTKRTKRGIYKCLKYNYQHTMTKRTKTGKKQKADLRKNEGQVDTSMGKKYLEEGRVVILESRFYDNSNK